MPIDSEFNACLTALKSLGAPRVWSLLVSVFGDLAPNPTDRIDGPLLTRLTDAMDIKPEAVRVALHRLRNDDWISSVKNGRTASHALTPNALKQRNAVAPLVYEPAAKLPRTWQVAITQSNDTKQKTEMAQAGFSPLMPRVYVAHGDVPAHPGVIHSKGTTNADWTAMQLVPEELTEQFEQLLVVLSTVHHRLSALETLSAIDTALLRCLILHHWRRLVLRHPYLPPALIGETWPGHQCRVLVVGLLTALPRPSLADLAAEERRTPS